MFLFFRGVLPFAVGLCLRWLLAHLVLRLKPVAAYEGSSWRNRTDGMTIKLSRMHKLPGICCVDITNSVSYKGL